MTRLSVKALRLYDRQGLLQPAHIDPSSGYRYYSLDQADRAEIIRVLRSIDMPLADIQEIVSSENDKVVSERLQMHKARLVDKLQAQETALVQLDRMIKSKAVIKPYEIQLSEEPIQHIAAVGIHTSLGKIANDIQTGFGTLVQGLGAAGVALIGAPMILYHNVIDQESEGDIEIAAPVATPFTSKGDVYCRELEAGTMATTIHLGHYEGIVLAYHALTRWISEQGFEITGATREIYLNDPQLVSPEELQTRIEFPISATDVTNTP